MDARQPPKRWEITALRLWHAALMGGFVVAYATGDEDTYRMHVFAGYWLLAALAVRLVLAMVGSKPGPLGFGMAKSGRRLFAWMAGLLLVVLGLADLSGVLADAIPAVEDPHEALANLALAVVLGHAAIVAWIFQGRRIRELLAAALLLAVLVGPAMAAEPARDAILKDYAAQVPGFAGFSPQRGEAIYRSRNTASPDYASCASCHTDDPTRPGRHAKTGRVIDPVAVSANPRRFTDAAKVEERFERDCRTVLGRACTPLEKGDYITFLASK
jgi:cytochrome c553